MTCSRWWRVARSRSRSARPMTCRTRRARTPTWKRARPRGRSSWSCRAANHRSTAHACNSNRERRAAQVLRPLHLDQRAKALLVRIAFLLGLDQALPDLLVDRARLVDPGGAVEARDPATRQKPRLAQRRLAEIDRDLGAVCEMARGRSLATFPQREMLVGVDSGAATRRDLRVTVGQRRADEADMRGIGSVDVLLQCFRNCRQDILPSVGHLAGGYGHPHRHAPTS